MARQLLRVFNDILIEKVSTSNNELHQVNWAQIFPLRREEHDPFGSGDAALGIPNFKITRF